MYKGMEYVVEGVGRDYTGVEIVVSWLRVDSKGD